MNVNEALKQYKGMAIKLAHQFSRKYQMDIDDCKQVADISIWRATEKYNKHHPSGAILGTYVHDAIAYNLIKMADKKNAIKRRGKTVNETEDMPLDQLCHVAESSRLETTEEIDAALKYLKENLTALQWKKYQIWLKTLSVTEAATEYGCSKQNMDIVVQKARKLLQSR